MRSISSREISTPPNALIRLSRKKYLRLTFGISPAMTISLASPPQIWRISLLASSAPGNWKAGSIPRSNRNRASDCKFSFRPVIAVLTGSKYAASRKTLVVFSVQPDLSPPITPANPSAIFSSDITIMLSSKT